LFTTTLREREADIFFNSAFTETDDLTILSPRLDDACKTTFPAEEPSFMTSDSGDGLTPSGKP
jgi:hypothetical protein